MNANLAVLVVAFGVTFTLTPVVRRLAERYGAVVAPDERRVHSVPTATIGGVAMFIALVASFAVAWQLDAFDAVFESSSEPLGVLLAAAVIFAVGLIDDLREVSAPARVAGMVLAGTILVRFGVSILFLRIPFYDLVLLSPDLSALITVLWVVGMANAVNLVDGLDGLAAGIVAIASGSFFLYSQELIDAGVIDDGNLGPLVAIITLGICLGFLPHNFNPAKIFMGDGGALLLGLLMASSTIAVGGSQNEPFSGQVYFFFAPLFIPLFILGVPIIDTLFAIIRRASRRSGVTAADKEHLHHRLMRLGHGQRRAVLILWAWTAALSGLVLYPAYTGEGDAVAPLAVIVFGFGLYVFFHPGMRRNGDAIGNGNGDGRGRAGPRGGRRSGRLTSASSAYLRGNLQPRAALVRLCTHSQAPRHGERAPPEPPTPPGHPVNPSFHPNLRTREADGLVLALELVLTTAIMAGLGLLLDRALGTVPIFTACFAAFTLAYEVWKIVRGYDLEMDRHTDERTPLRRGTDR